MEGRTNSMLAGEPMNASIAHWNGLIHLVKPKASDIRSLTGLKERPFHNEPIQAAGALTNNLFVSYFVQERSVPNPSILSVWIVFKDVFHGGVSVKPETLPPASMFGIRVPCSAQAFLQHLKTSIPNAPIQLSADPDRFTIDAGAARFEFTSHSGVATTPEECDLTTVTFFFSIGTKNPNRYEFSAAS